MLRLGHKAAPLTTPQRLLLRPQLGTQLAQGIPPLQPTAAAPSGNPAASPAPQAAPRPAQSKTAPALRAAAAVRGRAVSRRRTDTGHCSVARGGGGLPSLLHCPRLNGSWNSPEPPSKTGAAQQNRCSPANPAHLSGGPGRQRSLCPAWGGSEPPQTPFRAPLQGRPTSALP